jgi:hypothetical protein
MGRQINFFMTEEDELEFIGYLLLDANVVGFPFELQSDNIEAMSLNPQEKSDRLNIHSLWNKNISPGPCLEYVSIQGYYTIDVFESEVVEYSRSTYDKKGRLRAGRLWIETSYYNSSDPGRLHVKSEAFVDWYNQLAKWIKKHSVCSTLGNSKGWHQLPGAAKFVANGGILTSI